MCYNDRVGNSHAKVSFIYYRALAELKFLGYQRTMRLQITAQKLLAFDTETSKPVLNIKRWKNERPLGISCGATITSDKGMRNWHGGEEPDGRLREKMPTTKCRELAEYLLEMHASGYTILTWNGLEFDFDILAEECQDEVLRKGLAKLALNHIDIFFTVFSETGSLVSLDAAAKGMGIPRKADGLTGEDAPKMWRQSREMQEKVLKYNTQDVRLTMALHDAIYEKGYLQWTTGSGRLKQWKLTKDSIPTVAIALTGPEPDTSWMTEPVTRLDFYEWAKVLLPEVDLPYGLRGQSHSSRDRRQSPHVAHNVPSPPQTTPKAWSKDEEQRLLDAFDAGIGINELMQIHDRSRNAIVARLHRLGRILLDERLG